MKKRVIAGCALVLSVVAASGCGSEATKSSREPSQPREVVLAQFTKGVGAVVPGSKDPIWTDPAAVAAIDGSAVFSVRRQGTDRLVRLDRQTGAVVTSWKLKRGLSKRGLSINAVVPAGRWVALTDRGRGRREGRRIHGLVVFDPRAGTESHRLTLPGNLAPEAFSVDGKLVFALDFRTDHYRVQTIEARHRAASSTPATATRHLEPEDMEGSSVRGVISADHTLLATLYRNPGDAEEPAFVHVLDLEYGWSYCADLPEPFGTGPPGSDVIELTAANTVVVAVPRRACVAEIHIEQVHTPTDQARASRLPRWSTA